VGGVALTAEREALLAELAAWGRAHDARATSRAERMLNCGPETGRFLWLLTRFGGCRRVLEVGTSNGYSTLWLADAAPEVVTIEHDDAKVALARANFARAGLTGRIRLLRGDAGEVLAGGLGAPFDLVFLDADRDRYAAWWPALRPAVARGGLLVVDNAISHAAACAPLAALLAADPDFRAQTVGVGSGLLLAYRT
jgi:predicted O-methyltransferase YrrM